MSSVAFPVGVPALFRFEARGEGRNARGVRRIWLGVLLSVLIHGTLVVVIKRHIAEPLTPPDGAGPLTVELSAPRQPPTVPEIRPETPPRSAPSRPRPRPMLTVPSATPQPFQLPLDPIPVPERPRDRRDEPPSLADVVNARRAQREAIENAAALENASMRARESTGAQGRGNGLGEGLNFAPNKGNTGGVFQIIDKGPRIASFSFNGWNPSRVDKWREVIEVDAGLGGDVERAIVRRMIVLIRTHYKGDFQWDSQRVGHVIKLSAREEDNAGLEAFMLREFFPG